MSKTMVSVSIVILLYVPAVLIFNVTCLNERSKRELSYVLNSDITVAMRMGWHAAPLFG